MNLFLDTNIFLRYFAKDDQTMYQQAEVILSLVGESRVQIATSTIVLTEIIFTLRSFYKRNQEEIRRHIDSILELKNLLLVEKTNFLSAYQLFKKTSFKISDCLIVTQISPSYKLCSFDERLEKLMGKDRFILPSAVVIK